MTKKVNSKPCEYKKEFMKIKFESNDDLPLNKMLKLHNLTIIVGSIFKKKTSIINKSIYINFSMSYKNVTV